MTWFRFLLGLMIVVCFLIVVAALHDDWRD